MKGPQQLQEIFYRILFTEKKGITSITLAGEPVNVSATAAAAFISTHTYLQQGFGATLD